MKIEGTQGTLPSAGTPDIVQEGSWNGRSIKPVAGQSIPRDQCGYEGKLLHERRVSQDSGFGSMLSLVDAAAVEHADSEALDTRLSDSEAANVKRGLENIYKMLAVVGSKQARFNDVIQDLKGERASAFLSLLEPLGMKEVGQSLIEDIIGLLNQSLDTPVNHLKEESKEVRRLDKQYRKLSDKITSKYNKLLQSDKPSEKKSQELSGLMDERDLLSKKSLKPARTKLEQAILKMINNSPVFEDLKNCEKVLKDSLPDDDYVQAPISDTTETWFKNLVYERALNGCN